MDSKPGDGDKAGRAAAGAGDQRRAAHGELVAVPAQPACRRSPRTARDDVLRSFSGMSARMAEVCADYSDAELDLIAGFLRRTAAAGRAAVAQLDAD